MDGRMDEWMGNLEYWRIHYYFIFPFSGCWGCGDSLYYNMISLEGRGKKKFPVWIALTRIFLMTKKPITKPIFTATNHKP